MVEQTALQLILSFINESKIKAMMKWSDRKLYSEDGKLMRYPRVLTRKIREILNLLSGNDVVKMLKDVLNEKEREILASPKYKDALMNLSKNYNSTNLKERHNLVRPLKNANLKRTEVKRLGFSVSKKLWKTCSNTKSRNLGGGQTIPMHLRKSIECFLKENSNVASNRMIKTNSRNQLNNNRYVPVHYLQDNKICLFNKSPFKNLISQSTFYKYVNIDGQFKNPHRFTDLCEYCEKEKVYKNKVTKILENHLDNFQKDYNIKNLKKDIHLKAVDLKKQIKNLPHEATEEKSSLEARYTNFKSIIDDLRDYEALIFHKNVAFFQRKAYNESHKDKEKLRNKIMIEFDFKQKIVIGMSPRQVNDEYYNQVQRTCLGFGIYHLNSNDEIRLINFDIISCDLNQDAHAVVRGLRLLRQQEFFKAIDKKEYEVWCDAGKHFRNNEVLGYFLRELAFEKINVNLNFFAEKHGKNGRDAHFSNISRFIKAESLVRKLSSSQDIVDAIINRQNLANKNNPDENTHTILHTLSLDTETDQRLMNLSPENYTLTVLHLESCYNFRTIGPNFNLMTSVLSINDYLKNVDIKNVGKKIIAYVVADEIKCSQSEKHYAHIHAKKQRIYAALAQIKETHKDKIVDIDFINKIELGLNLEENEISLRQKPNFCRDELDKTKKKRSCCECDSLCAYTMEDLLDLNHGIGLEDLKLELDRHHHPKTRKMLSGKNRSTQETARELADHYIYSHNHLEPEFL